MFTAATPTTASCQTAAKIHMSAALFSQIPLRTTRWQLGDPVNALYLFPEHRFYGESLPAGPVDSYKAGTIDYLNIEEVGLFIFGVRVF